MLGAHRRPIIQRAARGTLADARLSRGRLTGPRLVQSQTFVVTDDPRGARLRQAPPLDGDGPSKGWGWAQSPSRQVVSDNRKCRCYLRWLRWKSEGPL